MKSSLLLFFKSIIPTTIDSLLFNAYITHQHEIYYKHLTLYHSRNLFYGFTFVGFLFYLFHFKFISYYFILFGFIKYTYDFYVWNSF